MTLALANSLSVATSRWRVFAWMGGQKLQAVIFMMTDETGYWNPGEALGLQPPFAITGHGRFKSGPPGDLTPRRASAGP